MVLPAGYYENVTVSTDIANLGGTVTYTHHQCSNTEDSATYTDDVIGTSNAASVNEITVNGKTVSTTQGGCYTTPYYKYRSTRTVGKTLTGYTYGPDPWIDQLVWTRDDGVVEYQGGGNWTKSSAPSIGTRGTSTVTGVAYGTTYSGTLLGTYYLKTCGHKNGELLSVTVTY